MNKTITLNAIHWAETRWQWVLVPLLAFTTFLWLFALGPNLQNFARALFYTLQFIVLNKDVYDGALTNAPSLLVFGLTVAQFLIPFVASVAFFGALFREQISPFLVKRAVKGLNDHHVVIGHGAIGQALSLSLSKRQKNVVVIDILANTQPDSPHLFHLQCDALSPALFDLANLGRAERIYILLPDERQNIVILDSLAKQQLRGNVTIYARAESTDLRRLFADEIWLKSWMSKPPVDIRPINPYDIVARGIVNEYSPDLYAPTNRNAQIAQTVMIVGVSDIAKALVLRFARLGIYSPKGKLRLIWAGKGVGDALAEMADSYPSLRPSDRSAQYWGLPPDGSTDFLRLVVTPLDIVTIDQPASQAVRDGHVGLDGAHQLPSVVYVCHNSDIQNAIESRDLQAALSAYLPSSKNASGKQRPILAIQNHAAIGIAQAQGMVPYGILLYGIVEVCIDKLFADTVVSDHADELAKRFDAAWSERACVDPSKWNSSSFFLKETNRDPADHAAIKARYAGIDAAVVKDCFIDALRPIGASAKLLDDHQKDLAYMEMRRYRAFMFLHGFRHGATSSESKELMDEVSQRYLPPQSATSMTDDQKKILKKLAKDLDRGLRNNETLLEEHLSSDQQMKDSDIVKVTIKALEMGVAN
jgi:hypothetical protein